jgi:L-ascorbate metabolism protein UlaG (beta-lactamase superfamily)
MDIFYLYNSGFSIELGGDALIIDYFRGRLGRQWRAPLDKHPSAYGNIYVFASHIHADHYNGVIFEWLSEREDIRYILSGDIRPAVPARMLNKDSRHTVDFINAGERLKVGNLDIRAYGSTDAGVSFHITAEDGTDIFHAGDFNYWHWRDESTDAEIGEAREMFKKELDIIKKGVSKPRAAFFPVDPRMGSDYYRGAVLFCEAVRPVLLVPMHFSSAFSPPREFYDEVAPYTKVAQTGPGSGKIIV